MKKVKMKILETTNDVLDLNLAGIVHVDSNLIDFIVFLGRLSFDYFKVLRISTSSENSSVNLCSNKSYVCIIYSIVTLKDLLCGSTVVLP